MTPLGIYLPPLGVLATYEDSGLGTFTHVIVRALVELQPWIASGASR